MRAEHVAYRTERCESPASLSPFAMNTDIPTQADFPLPLERVQDLEDWHAWETFGGRNLDETYAIFQENAFAYVEDLMWMPSKPFCFYLPIAGRYLESPKSSGD